jgi:hypothetical protein
MRGAKNCSPPCLHRLPGRNAQPERPHLRGCEWAWDFPITRPDFPFISVDGTDARILKKNSLKTNIYRKIIHYF